jgi:hypothetical protein
MPKRCSAALNKAFTSRPCASAIGRLNQLTLYTSRPRRARRSRATRSITLTCPPWALNSTSFFTPLAATDSPISVHSRITVSAFSVSVPAKRACSGLNPTAIVGRNSTGRSAASCGSAAATMPVTRSVSTDSGRCGPCCSVAATGSTATVRAASSKPKSVVVRSDQKRGGVNMRHILRRMSADWRPLNAPIKPRPGRATIIPGMTQDLFRIDAYLTECSATVTAITDHGIVLDRTVFYPLGGGQAGDAGMLVLADGSLLAIADTRKGKDAEGQFTHEICHIPASRWS